MAHARRRCAPPSGPAREPLAVLANPGRNGWCAAEVGRLGVGVVPVVPLLRAPVLFPALFCLFFMYRTEE